MNRKVLAIQYWNGDRDAALRTARYIADLERGRNDSVEFVFAVRGDANLPDEFTMKKVSRVFNVTAFRAPRHGAGHPWGCWVLWYSLIEWLRNRAQPAKWMLTFEADCVPMQRNWIAEIDREWDAAAPKNIRMLGAAPAGPCHINGNLVVSGQHDFLDWILHGVTLSGVPKPEGWDTWLFPEFLRWGCAYSDKFFSAWQTRTVGTGYYDRMAKEGVVFHHGVKDDSLLRQARLRLLGSGTQL